jgi:hypothetical protein
MALPVVGEGPAVEATGPLLEIRLLGFRKPVYGPILETLREAGYQEGDWKDPRPGDSLFSFSYDWRQDNVLSAGRLAKQLAALRDVQPQGRLAVRLICQSNGGHICRYFAKYGGASLQEAEAGAGGPPPGVEVRQLIFVGTANGGSLRMLRELHRGRRYLGSMGRKLQPETLFTFRSLFQDLPAYRQDLFVDADGKPLDIDLYQAETWQRYGWSVFDAKAQRRLAKAPLELFASAEERLAYLQEQLDRARRFQALLKRDSPAFGSPRYDLIQNVFTETPDRALMVQEDGRWEIFFTGDRRLRKAGYLRSVTAAPGDGHAAQASQLWLSPQELAALATEPHLVRGGHFEMILSASAKRRLVELLAP